MKGMKALNIPWGGHTLVFDGAALYFLMVALVVIVYLGLRMLVNSRFGNVIVAIRENEQRAELLGYDVRKYRLATFCIGSALAGLSGALYTAWGQFITPASVGLPAAAMPIVWVSFSGRRELTATLFGTFIFLYAYQLITVYSQQSALVLTGLFVAARGHVRSRGLRGRIGEACAYAVAQRFGDAAFASARRVAQ